MDITIARSRIKAAAALLGCVIFVVASLAIIATGSAVGFVAGLVGAVTFGVFGILWAWLGFRPGPGLRIDDDGFDDRSSAVAVGRVPWADVTGIGSWGAFGSSSVVVAVRDPEEYVSRAPWYARPAARAIIRLVGSSVTVASTGLRTSHEELLAELTAGYENFLGRTSGSGTT